MRFALVLALSGCTILGAVQGGQMASNRNDDREAAMRRGDPNPPPERSVPAWAIAGGALGLVIDVALFFVVAPRVNPSS